MFNAVDIYLFMLEILVVITILAGLLFLPTLTAYLASSWGYSFKKWFILGALLPVLSIVILIHMPDKSHTKSEG